MKKDHHTKKIGKYTVELTNLKKIFWPKEGYTKGDVIKYYETIWQYILPHLKNRPLSLKRNPNGIKDKGFYHKDAGENSPDFAESFPVKSKSSNKVTDYLVCNNKATLLYLANLGCIEMNPWNSTIKKTDQPTWMAIDIDPSNQNTFEQVVETALVTKEILDKSGMESFCKTSGASGIHVYIPLRNRYEYAIVREFAHLIVSHVHDQIPMTTTLERSTAKRGKKIYLDWLQNSEGQTLASVYSIRPVPGAFVSAPLNWKEVNKSLHPSKFTLKNMPARIRKTGDLFHPVLTSANHLEIALKRLNG